MALSQQPRQPQAGVYPSVYWESLNRLDFQLKSHLRFFLVSIYYAIRAMTDSANGQIPDCRGSSEAAEAHPRNDKAMNTQKSMAIQLARQMQLLLLSMMLGTDSL